MLRAENHKTERDNDITAQSPAGARGSPQGRVSGPVEPHHGTLLTLVVAVEDVGQAVGALEVEEGGDGQDEEQADEQGPEQQRGGHARPACAQGGRERSSLRVEGGSGPR